jgi:hypothetical protein
MTKAQISLPLVDLYTLVADIEERWSGYSWSPCSTIVTEPPNYDDPYVPIIVIMTSDSRTYVPHNLKYMLSSEHDPITGVLQYYNSLFKIPLE